MSKSKDLSEENQQKKNEELDLKYQEEKREIEEKEKFSAMQMKCNGLHSGTKFYEYYTGSSTSGHRIQYHEHPETNELVVIEEWAVEDGQDDVAYEFEVIGVYPPIACLLAKLNAPYMKDGKHFLLK